MLLKDSTRLQNARRVKKKTGQTTATTFDGWREGGRDGVVLRGRQREIFLLLAAGVTPPPGATESLEDCFAIQQCLNTNTQQGQIDGRGNGSVAPSIIRATFLHSFLPSDTLPRLTETD